MKAYTDRNREFVESFRAGTKCTYYWKFHTSLSESLMESLNPITGSCRDISRILITEGWRRGPDQKDRLLGNWRDIFRCAGHLQEGTLIECSTSQAIRGLAYRQILSTLQMQIFTELDAADLESAMRRHDNAAPSIRKAMIAEWAIVLDQMQRSIAEGKFDEMFIPPERIMELTTTILNEMVKNLDDDYASTVSTIDGPLSLEKLQKLRKLEPTDRNVKQHMVFSVLCPAIIRAYELSIRSLANRRGTLLVLVIHDFKARKKRWPASMDELTENDLKELRIDPFSEKDFRYKLTDRGFVLYSIAADTNDNNGRHDPKWGEGPDGGDYVFWPVQDAPKPTSQPINTP
ncbi:MAG: hypothetical protein AABZ08_12135 [Planctomycetota bacterium]